MTYIRSDLAARVDTSRYGVYAPDKPTMMLCGGAGYVGLHFIVEALGAFADTHNLVVADNFSSSQPVGLELLAKLTQHRPVIELVDVRDTCALAGLFGKYQPVLVIWLFNSPRRHYTSMIPHFAGTVKAISNLFQILRIVRNTHVLALSTTDVYCAPGTCAARLAETAPLRPESSDGVLALLLERYLTHLSDTTPARHVILRTPCIAGAHLTGALGSLTFPPHRFLHKLIYTARIPEWPARVGGIINVPKVLTDIIHVVDVAKAMVLASKHLLSPNPVSHCLNLCSGNAYDPRTLALGACQLMSHASLRACLTLPDGPAVPGRIADPARILRAFPEWRAAASNPSVILLSEFKWQSMCTHLLQQFDHTSSDMISLTELHMDSLAFVTQPGEQQEQTPDRSMPWFSIALHILPQCSHTAASGLPAPVQLLFTSTYQTLTAFIATMPQDHALRTMPVLLQLFHTRGGQALACARTALKHHVASVRAPTLLFRDNRLASQVIMTYITRMSTPYLVQTFSEFVQHFACAPPQVEMDPLRIKRFNESVGRRDRIDVQVSEITLKAKIVEITKLIVQSVDTLPGYVRMLCLSLSDLVTARFSHSNSGRAAVVAVMGLRLMCPFLLAALRPGPPGSASIPGVDPNAIDPGCQRYMLIIVKTLQALMASRELKEPFIQGLNPFLADYRPLFDAYFERLITVPDSGLSSGILPESIVFSELPESQIIQILAKQVLQNAPEIYVHLILAGSHAEAQLFSHCLTESVMQQSARQAARFHRPSGTRPPQSVSDMGGRGRAMSVIPHHKSRHAHASIDRQLGPTAPEVGGV